MQTLQGLAVSPGVTIGEALVLDNEGFRIPRRFVTCDAVEAELQRLDCAINAVAEEIEHNRVNISDELGDQYGAIFSAHAQMLRDQKLRDELEKLIRDKSYSPEFAVSKTLRRYAKFFQNLDNPYLVERAADIFDLEKSLLANLLGQEREELTSLRSPVIVLAHDLTPSETASLDREFVLGFATEVGGSGGHTAIVAKGLELPAVVGLGQFLADISGGDTVIIDGDTGQVIVQPDDETLARYQQEQVHGLDMQKTLDSYCNVQAETADGQRVQVLANIEFPHEVAACKTRGADGIGLYRTEFLYLGADGDPSEEVHFQAYADVVRELQGLPVTIRTLDLGADKMGLRPRSGEERNPFLGLRSIRLSLSNLTLFQRQLRAILRASALGPAQVMFPMITNLSELRKAKAELQSAMQALADEGIEFNPDIKVGMMVETPASVMMMDRFVDEVDFVSIGTNDLVQYTLAVDRSNIEVASLYQQTDPAVLRLIDMTITQAVQSGVKVTLCGQMSATPELIPLLLGLGLRELSVPPSSILEVKRVCQAVRISDCEGIAQHALQLDNAADINDYLKQEYSKLTPGLAESVSSSS